MGARSVLMTPLRIRGVAQSLAKQPFGSIGIAERRQQEVNWVPAESIARYR
jgi:hypothetical protein